MGTISRSSGAPYADGEILGGAELEGDFSTIYAEFNGGIDTVNLRDGAITTSKLAALAVSQDKMVDGVASASEAQFTAAETTLTTSYQTLGSSITHTVGSPARHVIITASFLLNYTASSSANSMQLQLLKDGISIYGVGLYDDINSPPGAYVNYPINRTYVDLAPTPGGTHTYTLQMKMAGGGAGVSNIVLVAFEPRR